MSGLFGVLRLPSPSVLVLYVATVIAEVPVIIARVVLTFAVLVLALILGSLAPERAASRIVLCARTMSLQHP
jgi:hypothetical protein